MVNRTFGNFRFRFDSKNPTTFLGFIAGLLRGWRRTIAESHATVVRGWKLGDQKVQWAGRWFQNDLIEGWFSSIFCFIQNHDFCFISVRKTWPIIHILRIKYVTSDNLTSSASLGSQSFIDFFPFQSLQSVKFSVHTEHCTYVPLMRTPSPNPMTLGEFEWWCVMLLLVVFDWEVSDSSNSGWDQGWIFHFSVNYPSCGILLLRQQNYVPLPFELLVFFGLIYIQIEFPYFSNYT